jgi:hypothetical protein
MESWKILASWLYHTFLDEGGFSSICLLFIIVVVLYSSPFFVRMCDLNKIYNSIYLDPNTPTGLADRVQMNVRLCFCRRANENMDSMTKDTFVVKQYIFVRMSM